MYKYCGQSIVNQSIPFPLLLLTRYHARLFTERKQRRNGPFFNEDDESMPRPSSVVARQGLLDYPLDRQHLRTAALGRGARPAVAQTSRRARMEARTAMALWAGGPRRRPRTRRAPHSGGGALRRLHTLTHAGERGRRGARHRRRRDAL